MSFKFALVGNPNSGKTTLYNSLTGANQFVGNWPGVTVEKKEGQVRHHKEIRLIDLPGIYSLSPYSPEEVIARNYLIEEKPDCIINIVDGSNIERNLYMTTQLLELDIPLVVAINMMDVITKNGDTLDIDKLSKQLGCPCVPISALKSEGLEQLTESCIAATKVSGNHKYPVYNKDIERALDKIQRQLADASVPDELRYLSVKLFERDREVSRRFEGLVDVDKIIEAVESQHDDDSDSILTNERFNFVTKTLNNSFKKANTNLNTLSDQIDLVITNRILALPIFIAIMFIVYFISITTVGTWVTDWTNDGLFGEGFNFLGRANLFVPGIPVLMEALLERIGTAGWLNGLILEGIVGGVGAVIGFLPQIAVLFFLLSILEDCGYMSRIAFIMDRIFRRFGLSGKSFIPMLISTGCAVPGIMSTRTIENINDRRMTAMTTSFMPCSAKLPVIALIAGAVFNQSWWVAPVAYFVGIASIVVSGIILKKTKLFAGDPSPFVMELPSYHLPRAKNVLRRVKDQSMDYAKRAASIILISAIGIWFLSNFGFNDGRFGMVEDINNGFLAAIGNSFAFIFAPLGFGHWRAAVAAITGLIAKENIVNTFGILYGYAEVSETGNEIWGNIAASFGVYGGFSFLLFNLLCAPCFAAIASIRREMANIKWTVFAIAYQCTLAYAVALVYYQFASWLSGNPFGIWTAVAVLLTAFILIMLLRPARRGTLKAVPLTSHKGA